MNRLRAREKVAVKETLKQFRYLSEASLPKTNLAGRLIRQELEKELLAEEKLIFESPTKNIQALLKEVSM